MAVKSLSESSIRQNPVVNSMLAGHQTNQFHHLETIRLGGNAASVEFINLARYADYQHLQIRMSLRSSNAALWEETRINFNGSATGYRSHTMFGYESSPPISTQDTAAYVRIFFSAGNNGPAGAFSAAIVDILDPFETTKSKVTRSLSGRVPLGGENRVGLSSGLWSNTAAISSMVIAPTSGSSWIAGSRFSLYGLRARS